MWLNVVKWAAFFYFLLLLKPARGLSQTPTKDDEMSKTGCSEGCKTKYSNACQPPFEWIKSMNCEPWWQRNVEKWRNPELHWVGNDDILGEYTILQGCREEWTIADLHTEVVATLFWCNKSWARVSQSEVWKHSGSGWQKWSRRWIRTLTLLLVIILLFCLSWTPAAPTS